MASSAAGPPCTRPSPPSAAPLKLETPPGVSGPEAAHDRLSTDCPASDNGCGPGTPGGGEGVEAAAPNLSAAEVYILAGAAERAAAGRALSGGPVVSGGPPLAAPRENSAPSASDRRGGRAGGGEPAPYERASGQHFAAARRPGTDAGDAGAYGGGFAGGPGGSRAGLASGPPGSACSPPGCGGASVAAPAAGSAPATFRRLNLYPYAYPSPDLHGTDQFVAALPPRDRAAPAGHASAPPAWHYDASKVGALYEQNRVFVKQRKDGCISLIYEQQLRERGRHGYALTIYDGVVSPSDGVGFVFAERVPCSKNIKRLWSVFANRAGHVVKRLGPRLVRSDQPLLPPLAVGQTLSLVIDLDRFAALFQSSNAAGVVHARAVVDLADVAELVDCSRGYLCSAVTRAGMIVHLAPAPTDLFECPPVERGRTSLPHHYRAGPHPQPQQQLQPPAFRRPRGSAGGGGGDGGSRQPPPPPPPPLPPPPLPPFAPAANFRGGAPGRPFPPRRQFFAPPHLQPPPAAPGSPAADHPQFPDKAADGGADGADGGGGAAAAAGGVASFFAPAAAAGGGLAAGAAGRGLADGEGGSAFDSAGADFPAQGSEGAPQRNLYAPPPGPPQRAEASCDAGAVGKFLDGILLQAAGRVASVDSVNGAGGVPISASAGAAADAAAAADSWLLAAAAAAALSSEDRTTSASSALSVGGGGVQAGASHDYHAFLKQLADRWPELLHPPFPGRADDSFSANPPAPAPLAPPAAGPPPMQPLDLPQLLAEYCAAGASAEAGALRPLLLEGAGRTFSAPPNPAATSDCNNAGRIPWRQQPPREN